MPDRAADGGGVGPAAAVVDVLLERPARLGAVRWVAIDGPSGSGKTWFASDLAVALRARDLVVTVVSTDLLATWDDPFDWWSRWEAGLLGPLAGGRPGALLTNEWVDGAARPGPLLDIEVPGVLITEGVSSGRRAATDRLSLLVWVQWPGVAGRLRRSITRDGADSRRALMRWQVQEQEFFSRDGTAARADVRVDAARGAMGTRVVAR